MKKNTIQIVLLLITVMTYGQTKQSYYTNEYLGIHINMENTFIHQNENSVSFSSGNENEDFEFEIEYEKINSSFTEQKMFEGIKEYTKGLKDVKYLTNESNLKVVYSIEENDAFFVVILKNNKFIYVVDGECDCSDINCLSSFLNKIQLKIKI